MVDNKSRQEHPREPRREESAMAEVREENGGGRNLWKRWLAWRARRREAISEKRRRKGVLRDWIDTVVSVVIIVFVIRVGVVEAYRIPTGSMEDTLLIGDFLLVNKFIYGIRTPDWVGIPFTNIGLDVPYTRLPGFADPNPGDIIVFRFPLDTRINYIKRCVAVGGQTVELRDKRLYVDGEFVPLPPKGKFTSDFIVPRGFIHPQILPMGAGNKDNYGPVRVPRGYVFMMGDNRDNSADSRFWGFLPEELILGKAMVLYFSWDRSAPLYRFWDKVRWKRLAMLIR